MSQHLHLSMQSSDYTNLNLFKPSPGSGEFLIPTSLVALDIAEAGTET